MFHANAWGLPYAALMAGADLVLPDRHLDARSLIHMVENLRPTLAGAVPTIWNDVMHHLEKDPGHDMSSLRLVVCGGSAVPVSLMRTFEDKHDVQIRQLWGMTETSPLATMAWPPPETPEDQHWAFRVTQGQPVCGVETRIVDDDGAVLPNDGKAVGEVEVRGPWITGSYYRGQDESKFDSGWLRTGDVGRIDEHGFITLTDRAKDVIKSGGEWISSVELENCLIAHPDVLEAAVVGVPDERWQERPLAVVVPKEGADSQREQNCESSWRTRSFDGGCPNGGPSPTRFRAPAWASTTRKPSGPATPTMTIRSPRCATERVSRRRLARFAPKPRFSSARREGEFMSLRVVQWATGSVGVAAIKGVLEHPELELVGCWVHSEAKSGKDVGEIIGASAAGSDRHQQHRRRARRSTPTR